METLSLEQLAEKLGGKLWIKEDKKRIYLDRGYNTKKMSTKTYVYQREDGTFGVSCYIDCPSQAYQWIKSQQEEVIKSVEESIEAAEFEIENPGVDYYEHNEVIAAKKELAQEAAEFESKIDYYKNCFIGDYNYSLELKAKHEQNEISFNSMDAEMVKHIEELKAEQQIILGTPGSAKRNKEINKELAALPCEPKPIIDVIGQWRLDAMKFNTPEEYADFKISERRAKYSNGN